MQKYILKKYILKNSYRKAIIPYSLHTFRHPEVAFKSDSKTEVICVAPTTIIISEFKS